MVSEESPIEESVTLDCNYPSFSERYFTNYYFIPKDLSKPETGGGDEKIVNGKNNSECENPQDNGEEVSQEKENAVESKVDVKASLPSPDNTGHTCVMVHTNKLCLLTISHRHPVLAEKKEITKINFDVGKFNRLENQVTGKGKRGAQQIGLRSPICIISCSDGSQYTVLAGVHGKLVEVNERLVSNPRLLSERPNAEGYLAVVYPPLRNGDFMRSRLFSKEEYNALDQ